MGVAKLRRGSNVEIQSARTPAHWEAARTLIREYAAEIRLDLAFQAFEHEITHLPEVYAGPAGCLVLGMRDGAVLGCVAVRPRSPDVCEMKRLYVRPAYRRLGVGRKLAEEAVQFGWSAGYRAMCLDTIGTMAAALALYATLGFERIAPYYENPLAGAVFLGRELTGA